MGAIDIQYHKPARGSFWKGLALGLGCQVAYLLFVFYLPLPQVRLLGYLMFALVQFTYLYPLAAYFQKSKQALTSIGVLVVGVISLLVAAVWFGYAIFHNALPSLSAN